MTPRLNKTNIAKLIKYIKKSWGVSREGMDLTIGYNPKTKEWDYQSGDNSYSGACYFYPLWGVTTGLEELELAVQMDLADMEKTFNKKA